MCYLCNCGPNVIAIALPVSSTDDAHSLPEGKILFKKPAKRSSDKFKGITASSSKKKKSQDTVQESSEEETQKPEKSGKKIKNNSLLSFGGGEDDEEDEEDWETFSVTWGRGLGFSTLVCKPNFFIHRLSESTNIQF